MYGWMRLQEVGEEWALGIGRKGGGDSGQLPHPGEVVRRVGGFLVASHLTLRAWTENK